MIAENINISSGIFNQYYAHQINSYELYIYIYMSKLLFDNTKLPSFSIPLYKLRLYSASILIHNNTFGNTVIIA